MTAHPVVAPSDDLAASPAPGDPPSEATVRVVDAALAPGGPLARAWTGWRDRPGQRALARAAAETIAVGGVLAAQAGTGVGKTVAYLVPVLLSGRRAILSTATQALQDQLFHRDIPAVAAALQRPVRAALLKGRSAYLCRHRLQQAAAGAVGAAPDLALARALPRVVAWSAVTRRGDLAELGPLATGAWRERITATREQCLGTDCPEAAACHVFAARREALAADWVVVNHHVLMADQDVRESGQAALLPSADVVVVDEAHAFNDTAIGFLGRQLGSAGLARLVADVQRLGAEQAAGMGAWTRLGADLTLAGRSLAQASGGGVAEERRPWDDGAPAGADGPAWRSAAVQLDRALGALHAALLPVADLTPDLRRLGERAASLRTDWRALAGAPAADGWVRWWERPAPGRWRAVMTPADCGEAFQPWKEAVSTGQSWVFTSATLDTDPQLAGFARALGLPAAARVLRVPGAFDHARQAALHIPGDLPEPGDDGHSEALAARVAVWADRLGGRTLVLTTTRRAARRIAETLAVRLSGSLTVLAPSATERTAALQRWQRAGGQGMVMVGAGAFWQGVDLPGDMLQLVVIDKLPFAPPDDPLHRARLARAEAAGLDGFLAVSVPQAALTLAQGVGRLIRGETDRGVVVIGDPRLWRRSYGAAVLEALPPMAALTDEQALTRALDALAGLTRSSTRDLLSSGSPG